MTTLVLIDGRHEELIAALPPLSSKLAAVRLLAHLRELPSLQEAPQSLFYHVDTARRLCALILESSPISGHIGFLRDLLDTLSSDPDSPAAPRVQTLESALARLRLLLTAEFAVRGQWPEVRAVLPDAAFPAESQPDLTSFLAALAEHPEAAGLQWPFHLRDPAISVGKGSVLTVLVDGPSIPETHREAYLTLLSAKVTIRRRRGEEAHVVRSRDDTGEDLPLGDDLKDLVREATDHALRLLGPDIVRRARRHRFEIEIALRRPDPVTTVQGRSILLPLVLLLAEQLSEQLNLPFAFLPSRSLVWTGDIDQHGSLATVGDIGLKAARVAASRIRGFACPAVDQAAVEVAHSDAPPKSRCAHGLTTLADVTTRPEFVITRGRGVPRRVAFSIQRKTRPLGIAGALAVAALLAALAFLIPRISSWLDTTAHTAHIIANNTQIETLNARGRRIARFDIPRTAYPVPALADIDGDERPEVFFGTSTHDSIPGILGCYTGQGEHRWRFHGGFGSSGQRPYELTDTFGASAVSVHDIDGDGINEIIAFFTHTPWAAAQVALLTPDGQHRGSFWNPGHFTLSMFNEGVDRVGLADIDGDGLVEILVSGTNDPCGRAVLAVLDPRSFSGQAPTCRGVEPESTAAQSYVLFPRPALFDTLGVTGYATRGVCIENWQGQPTINVGTRINVPGTGLVGVATYYLDYNLNVVDLIIGRDFYTWLESAAVKAGIGHEDNELSVRLQLLRTRVLKGSHSLFLPAPA